MRHVQLLHLARHHNQSFVDMIAVSIENHFTCMLRTDHLDAQGVVL